MRKDLTGSELDSVSALTIYKTPSIKQNQPTKLLPPSWTGACSCQNKLIYIGTDKVINSARCTRNLFAPDIDVIFSGYIGTHQKEFSITMLDMVKETSTVRP